MMQTDCKKDKDLKLFANGGLVARTILALLLSLAAVVPVAAQNAADTVESLPGIEITTSVDLADIYVGDLITYKIAITYDSTYQLIPPPLGVNLGAFDVRDYTPDVTTDLPDGRKHTENSFTLSTFTTGDYLIPPVPVGFILPDGNKRYLLSESVPIKVNSMLLDSDDSADIASLKDPYEFKRDYFSYYLWGSIALFLLLVGLFLWWKFGRRKPEVELVDLRPPWEVAFERLANLKQQSVIADGEIKAYYIELTEIAREYLGRMYIINVLDMTTGEFLSHFAEREAPDNLHADMKQFLDHADLVKFARFDPAPERAESDFEFVHRVVGLVQDDFERRQRELEAAQANNGSVTVRGGSND
ncbi:MAG: hypothetical protein P1R58_11595 [bacterium]|nr:hypothetical protein [bacterium]